MSLLDLLSARRGHFKLESGHHGDLWLDLDQLFLRPRALQPFVVELARLLSQYNLDAICGAVMGGALIAQSIAAELDIEFYYTERFASAEHDGLYPVEYRLPQTLRKSIAGKSVAIVDDVINAGSAVRGTFAALESAGAVPKVVGALLTLGSSASEYFASKRIPIESVARQSNGLWMPAECPLCADSIPLEDLIPSI